MSTKQALSNARWVGISQASRQILQFASVAILSRLLPSADFGLMAMAVVVSNLGILFRDLGTAAALVQKREITDELIDTVFWLNVAFGVIVGGLVLVLSPVAAHLFHAPALTGILACLSVMFPIAATGASQFAVLERQHQFRAIARIEVISSAAGLLAAVLGALHGMGVYSFVLQVIVVLTLSSIQIWAKSRHRLRFSWSANEFRGIFGFSGNLTIFNFVDYFARNADSILIGRFLGAVSLGWYSIAYRILLFPIHNLTFVSSRALLPVYSRYQDDPATVRALYLRTLALIGSITCPLMLGLWALRSPFVLVAFGSRWTPVAPILMWFAPMGFIQSLLSTTGMLLTSIGRTDILRTLGIINSVVLVASFAGGIHFGLMGLVIAYFCAVALTAITSLQVTLVQVGSGIIQLASYIWGQTLCAIAMAGFLSILNSYFRPRVPALALLIILVPAGAAFYTLALFLFSRPSLVEIRKALLRRASSPALAIGE
jgi:PST family polysaccharide transporter